MRHIGLACVIPAMTLMGGCERPPDPPIPTTGVDAPAPSNGREEDARMVKKDPEVPLIIVAETIDGVDCPIKVIGVADDQCVPKPGDHKACRYPEDTVRWIVLSKDTLDIVKADFEIRFKDSQAPFEKKGSGIDKSCGKSRPGEGELDCRVKKQAAIGDYGYDVIMSGGETCKLDPTITVNPRVD